VKGVATSAAAIPGQVPIHVHDEPSCAYGSELIHKAVLDAQQLDLKDERGIRRDDGRVTAGP
jgi:hypothetical protein